MKNKRKQIVIFGAGTTGQRIYYALKNVTEIVGFLDNDETKWGKKIDNILILGNANVISELSFDEIVICSLTGLQIIREELLLAGVPAEKIRVDYIETQVKARNYFLYDFAKMYYKFWRGGGYAAAEGGVFQGEFSKEINRCFPDNFLYLFDTFEGFDKRDLDIEWKNAYSHSEAGHLGITSEKMVLEKMPFKDKVRIKKGYFPETVNGLEETRYFFVSLDFDLYQPTLDGLKFFYPRLVVGGCILVHDYFNTGYFGVEKAVKDFEDNLKVKLYKFPIGDLCSIGIMK